MLRFEPNVRIDYLGDDMSLVLHHASVWALLTGIGVVVNSMADGRHNPGSLHPWGLGVDLDTEGDRAADLKQLHGYLARVLPTDYDVLLESDHVHVERDNHRDKPKIDPAVRRGLPHVTTESDRPVRFGGGGTGGAVCDGPTVHGFCRWCAAS